MFTTSFIESALVRLFRFQTRGFLRMEELDGGVPPAPRDPACYLYVHIPFCEVLCPFCSFHRVTHCSRQARRYFTALRREIGSYQAAGFRFSGVYFGGGTPTIEPEELLDTIGMVRSLFPVREISVETNPCDLRPPLLELLRRAGVTRLSVGAQTFDDDLLRAMDRYEKYGSGAIIAEHIRQAASLFPTLNVDLIFNLPNQTRSALERDLATVRTLGANQVSCYPLMTSPAVARRMRATMGRVDPARREEFYRTIVADLAPEFRPSSAWCFSRKVGASDEYFVSAENYVGVGSGAFSYLDGTLYSTTFSLPAYERRIADGQTGIVTQNHLGEIEQMRYTLLVGLFGLGLDRATILRRHGPSFFQRMRSELRAIEWLGIARREPDGWHTTERGMYWVMRLMAEFFGSVNAYRDAMREHIQSERPASAHDRANGSAKLAAPA